jgi:hypothetical protein
MLQVPDAGPCALHRSANIRVLCDPNRRVVIPLRLKVN